MSVQSHGSKWKATGHEVQRSPTCAQDEQNLLSTYMNKAICSPSRQSAHVGGKVVSLTHQQPLPPGNIPGTHFL